MKRTALILAAAIGFAALTGCAESALEAKIPDSSVNVTVSSSASEVKEKSTPVPAATAKSSAKVEKTAVTDKPAAAPKPTKKPEELAVPESTETKSTAAPESETTAETASVAPEASSEPETPSSSRQVTVPNPEEVPAAAPTVIPADTPAASRTAPAAQPTAIPTAVPTAVPTPVPTAAPTAVPTPATTAFPTPEPTPEPIPETTPEPVPSGPYDYPFDVSAICSDLIGVGQSMGLTHITSMDGESLTPSNTSWSMPVTASQSFQGAALETSLKDYVRSMPDLIASYGGAPLQFFSIYVESLGGGSYCFYFLY